MANDIKYDIIADATRFGNGVRTAEKDALRLQQTVNSINASSSRATGSFATNSGRASMAVTQLAYGVEDAISQFGTMGLAGALRGASNNLTGFAAALGGPKAILATVVGTSIGALALQFWNSGKAAKNAANDIDTYTDRLKKNQEQIQSNIAFQQKLRDIRTAEKASEEAKGFSEEMERRAASVADLRRQFQNLQAVVENANKANQTLDQDWMALGWFFSTSTAKEEERLKAIREAINKEEAEIAKARARFGEIQENMPAIKQREQADEAAKKQKDSLEEQKKLAEDLARATLTPQEEYAKQIEKINQLKQNGLVTDQEALKYADDAYKKLLQQNDAQKAANRMLTEAADIRSAEAYSIVANAMVSALMPNQQKPAQIPMQWQVQQAANGADPIQQFLAKLTSEEMKQPLDKSAEKTAQATTETARGVNRLADTLGRQPTVNLRVVGMN